MDIRKQFRENILAMPKDTSIAILHDTDADGICSAVILAKALKELGHDSIFLHDTKNRASFGSRTLAALRRKNIKCLFTADKALDSNPAMILRAEKICQLIVFDHHHLEHDITSRRTLLIKPQLFSPINPSQYPTSKLVYDFFGELADITKCDWICAAGVISDASYRTWNSFIDDIHRRHRLAVPVPIFSSDIARAGQSINTAALYNEKTISRIVDIVYDSLGPLELQHSLQQYVVPVRAEIDKWLSMFNEKSEWYPEQQVYWYYINPKFPIGSIISTRVSMKDPHATFIIAEKRGNILSLSLRRQDGKVDCIRLVRTLIAGIRNATGGGHIPAAGDQIPYKEKEAIKKKLLLLKAA